MNTYQRHMAIRILVLGLFISGCGAGQPAWPSGTGYITPAARKPSAPYKIQTDKTNWEIYGGNSGSGYSGNGDVEYKDSKSLAFAVGAIITNRTTAHTSLTLKDFNGDKCVIPYGMTVRIDKYGQYVPVKYNPDLPPPTP
jgi:hypothetical protein